LSDTSIPVLVTTAFALLNASWAVQGAAPRQRLFGFLNLFKQSNRKHFAIVVLSRMLIECLLARQDFRPCDP
jgi:hypothetical protein